MSYATTNLEVHHVRKLAGLNKSGRREKPSLIRLMAMRRRKVLAIFRRCHEDRSVISTEPETGQTPTRPAIRHRICTVVVTTGPTVERLHVISRCSSVTTNDSWPIRAIVGRSVRGGTPPSPDISCG
ncbi:HNH endonuclease [Nocardia sp. NBC_01730]|uniref:HNH endonuclease n=1 Tax=Nocardia sp. NBC_01730 TaxID=2975998 RepID=UPI003FA3A1CB